MKVTDEMVEAGLSAARDASEARLPRYSVVRAILEAALSHAAGQEAVFWMVPDLQKWCHALSPAQLVHRVMLSTERNGEYNVPLYLAPINPAEIDRKLVGGEAVAQVLEIYKAEEEDAWFGRVEFTEPLKVGDLLYTHQAQPPASAEVGRKLMDDLNRIAYGYLPDGDGVDTSVALWAEQTLSRMAASSGRKVSPIAGVTHGIDEGWGDE